jgi:hypothetical protein
MAEQLTVNPRFYALTESLELGKATCREAGLELAALEERIFEGGEFKLRPLDRQCRESSGSRTRPRAQAPHLADCGVTGTGCAAHAVG